MAPTANEQRKILNTEAKILETIYIHHQRNESKVMQFFIQMHNKTKKVPNSLTDECVFVVQYYSSLFVSFCTNAFYKYLFIACT